MSKPRTAFGLLRWTDPPEMVFYGSGPGYLLSWLGMVNAGWLGPMRLEIFLQL